MTLTEYLKQLRKVHGYKQDLVADFLEISRQTYSAYETGRIKPTVPSIKKLAALYHVSVESFIDKIELVDTMIDMPSKTIPSVMVEEMSASSDKAMKAFLEFTSKRKEQMKAMTVAEKWLLFYFSNMNSGIRSELLNYLAYRYASDADHPKPPKL